MFDIKSFYEAKDVADAINALVKNPDAEIISGGTDVLIRVREGKDAGRSVVFLQFTILHSSSRPESAR